jgi:hypothetical protein
LTDKATGALVEDPEAFITSRRRGDGGTHTDEIVDVVATGKTTGNRFRYDPISKTHQYNWNMNSVPPGDYVFTLTWSKGGSHSGFVTRK